MVTVEIMIKYFLSEYLPLTITPALTSFDLLLLLSVAWTLFGVACYLHDLYVMFFEPKAFFLVDLIDV